MYRVIFDVNFDHNSCVCHVFLSPKLLTLTSNDPKNKMKLELSMVVPSHNFCFHALKVKN